MHLACAALEAGERIVLDTDPQNSAIAWGTTREKDEPIVEAVEPGRLEAFLGAAERAGMTIAIVDTAPRAAPEAAAILRLVDFVVVPLRPSAFDLATLAQTVRIVTTVGKEGCIVLNAGAPRAIEVGETRFAISNLAIPRAPIEIGERRAYARAVATGRSVTEFDPSSSAANEISALWIYIKERLR